jgi:hypothetical protein
MAHIKALGMTLILMPGFAFKLRRGGKRINANRTKIAYYIHTEHPVPLDG